MGFVLRSNIIESSTVFYWLIRKKYLSKFIRVFEPRAFYMNYYYVSTGKLIEEQRNINPIWFCYKIAVILTFSPTHIISC